MTFQILLNFSNNLIFFFGLTRAIQTHRKAQTFCLKAGAERRQDKPPRNGAEAVRLHGGRFLWLFLSRRRIWWLLTLYLLFQGIVFVFKLLYLLPQLPSIYASKYDYELAYYVGDC